MVEGRTLSLGVVETLGLGVVETLGLEVVGGLTLGLAVVEDWALFDLSVFNVPLSLRCLRMPQMTSSSVSLSSEGVMNRVSGMRCGTWRTGGDGLSSISITTCSR